MCGGVTVAVVKCAFLHLLRRGPAVVGVAGGMFYGGGGYVVVAVGSTLGFPGRFYEVPDCSAVVFGVLHSGAPYPCGGAVACVRPFWGGAFYSGWSVVACCGAFEFSVLSISF